MQNNFLVYFSTLKSFHKIFLQYDFFDGKIFPYKPIPVFM